MTINEIAREINANQKRLKQEMQFQAQLAYLQPQLTAMLIGSMFSKNGGNKYPELYELFPQLFDEEIIEEKKQKMMTEKSVANFMNFAMAFNKKRHKEQEE